MVLPWKRRIPVRSAMPVEVAANARSQVPLIKIPNRSRRLFSVKNDDYIFDSLVKKSLSPSAGELCDDCQGALR